MSCKYQDAGGFVKISTDRDKMCEIEEGSERKLLNDFEIDLKTAEFKCYQLAFELEKIIDDLRSRICSCK